MVKIHRIWFNTERMDREDHYKITLFSRPRVSIHVDEYIWSFIEENIVKPHKLMRSEKHEYLLDIAFGQFDPAKHRFFPLSSYNGLLREGVEMDSANRSYFREDFAGGKDRTTWFSPNKIWTNCGDKVLNVDIKAANVSENITPREYADLLFDGIGAALVFNFKRLKREEFDGLKPKIEYADLLFDGIGAALVFNFKRLKREEFDGLKPKIDWSIVESFPFPAPFEEQRYIGDGGKIHVYSWDGRQKKTDFDTGKVIFLDATRKEDMLQVEYPNCFLLDMGWYQDRYIISVIHNFDWANPVQQYETTETNQLPKLLTEAVRLVEKESQSAGAN